MLDIRLSLIGLFVISLLVLSGCTSSPTGHAIADPDIANAAAEYKADAKGYSEQDGMIVIDDSDLSSTLKKYNYGVAGQGVVFLAVKGSDGLPRIAFDVCSDGTRGIVQELTHVVCPVGTRFDIDAIGKRNWGDGVYPVHLPHNYEAGKIYIDKDVLEDGMKYFR